MNIGYPGGGGSGTPTRAMAMVQTVIATSGQVINAIDAAQDSMLWVTPAAALAALTINFPSDASSTVGDTFRYGSSKAVSTLTLAGAVNIFNGSTSLSANQLDSYKKVSADSWARIQ